MSDRKTGDVLIELGITPELKGFKYIIDMLEEMGKSSEENITSLYVIVGEKNHASGSRVERAIRNAVDKRINIQTDSYKKYVGIYPKRLTNAAFLYALKYKLDDMEDR